jgi:DNA-binding beta-propeller fold protein YncE
MRISLTGLIISYFLFAGISLGAELSFKSAPVIKKTGDKVSITFTLSKATDCEVAVLDAKNKIVRHLAAGLLGDQTPPPPPLKTGLSQSILWDGLDFMGEKATGGPFKIRIRAGMSVKYGRMIGGSPYTGGVTGMPYRAPVNGLVSDGQGKLYVKMMSTVGSHGNSGIWPWHIRRFDAKGKYEKTILPHPPSTPPEKATGFKMIATADGSFAPANRNSLYGVFYNFGNELSNRIVDGQLVFVQTERRLLHLFKLDGSNAVKTINMWSKKAKLKCARWLDIQVAFSPDGKYVYYSNVAGVPYDGKKPADISADWPQGRVYRQDLSKPGLDPVKFFDFKLPDFEQQKYWMPSAWDKKSAAAGIDVDAKGNVLVCDLVNQVVHEISPAGKELSQTAIPWPDKVLVNRKTNDLYVFSRKVSRGSLPPAKIYKISGRGQDAKTVSELQLKGTIGSAATLDQSGKKTVIWVAGASKGGYKGGDSLLRIVDSGAALEADGDSFLNKDKKAIAFLGYSEVDAQNELVYVTKSGGTVWRYNGETGEGGPLKIKAVDLAVGPNGQVFTWGVSGSYSGPIGRFDRDLNPLPNDSGKHTFGYLYGRAGRGSSVCGMDVDKHGRVYATWGSNACHVRVYGKDGKLVDFPQKLAQVDRKTKKSFEIPVAIDYCSGYGGSIRVDLAGNIYLLQYSTPKGFKPPAGYEKDPAYKRSTGTILKFGPQGSKRKVKINSGGRGGDPLGFEGILATYPDCGPISSWNCAGSCACTKPRFDVDGFGRLYIPNAITFKVSVRDNAGNEILKFGQYGNFDCQGPESSEPKPAIPLGWPVTAGASDRFIYVGDCLNHRVVRVDKTWALEKLSEIPASR